MNSKYVEHSKLVARQLLTTIEFYVTAKTNQYLLYSCHNNQLSFFNSSSNVYEVIYLRAKQLSSSLKEILPYEKCAKVNLTVRFSVFCTIKCNYNNNKIQIHISYKNKWFIELNHNKNNLHNFYYFALNLLNSCNFQLLNFVYIAMYAIADFLFYNIVIELLIKFINHFKLNILISKCVKGRFKQFKWGFKS